VDALLEQVRERRVDRALALQPGHPRKGGGDDPHREMAFAAAVVAGMAAMQVAVVDHLEPRGSEGGAQALVDEAGERTGARIGHRPYIDVLAAKGSKRVASAGRRETRFHGRTQAQGLCDHPGCDGPGEFRAPSARAPSFDGPGDWRWMCLDHIRAFNAGYDYFEGMSADEISASQNAYGGWDRETRAFASVGGGEPPRWAEFTDPLDAIGARFRRSAAEGPRRDGRELSESDRKSLRILGLGTDADRRALRRRYADLLRRFHPDHNGGDRGHEKALQAVIDAYTQLKSRPAFA